MSTRTTMAEHSFSVEWRFVVPPDNTHRIVIHQRQDGRFRANTVGGRGYYCTSIEAITDDYGGGWAHMPGSSTGGHPSFQIAMEIAERKWREVVAQALGSTPCAR